LAAGGDGHRSVPAVAGEAGAGFATPTDLLLLGAVAILAVGLLLVFIWTRRAARDEAADASAPPAWERPAGPPPEQLRPPVPLLPAQPRGTTPLERRRPMPPDAAFTVIERGQDGARHRAADPPAPAMLSNQALITGRVAGPEGHPVSGGKLTVSDFSGSPAGIGRSATDGRYRLHLPTGGTYLLVCTAEGHQSTTVMVTVAAATLVCDIVLGGAGGIDGWIRHQRGEAAAGAMVTLTDLRGEVVASTMAGRTGGYRLTGLNAGEYTLVASAAGTQPSACTVQVPANGVRQLDMVLQSNGALRGTVRAAAGARPVPDASVALVDGRGGVVAAIMTGADGEYVFAEVPPGGYTLVASGYPPVATWIELTGERTEVRDVILGAHPQRSGAAGNGEPHTLAGFPPPGPDTRPESGRAG